MDMGATTSQKPDLSTALHTADAAGNNDGSVDRQEWNDYVNTLDVQGVQKTLLQNFFKVAERGGNDANAVIELSQELGTLKQAFVCLLDPRLDPKKVAVDNFIMAFEMMLPGELGDLGGPPGVSPSAKSTL